MIETINLLRLLLFAVVSVDEDDFWGYPSARVLERLKKAGVKVYRTDREGDIVLSISVVESWE